ncbi:hypothetical protein AHAS_Ahas11G0283500 [Arachis hypogaea]
MNASGAVVGDLRAVRLGRMRTFDTARMQEPRDLAAEEVPNLGCGNWLVNREQVSGKDSDSGAHPTVVEDVQGVANGERTLETMAGSNTESRR